MPSKITIKKIKKIKIKIKNERVARNLYQHQKKEKKMLHIFEISPAEYTV